MNVFNDFNGYNDSNGYNGFNLGDSGLKSLSTRKNTLPTLKLGRTIENLKNPQQKEADINFSDSDSNNKFLSKKKERIKDISLQTIEDVKQPKNIFGVSPLCKFKKELSKKYSGRRNSRSRV